MKKETKIQVEGELKKVESDIHRLQYHLVGLDNEKRKTKRTLEELQDRKKKLKSYL
jgi:phage shock protein A